MVWEKPTAPVFDFQPEARHQRILERLGVPLKSNVMLQAPVSSTDLFSKHLANDGATLTHGRALDKLPHGTAVPTPSSYVYSQYNSSPIYETVQSGRAGLKKLLGSTPYLVRSATEQAGGLKLSELPSALGGSVYKGLPAESLRRGVLPFIEKPTSWWSGIPAVSAHYADRTLQDTPGHYRFEKLMDPAKFRETIKAYLREVAKPMRFGDLRQAARDYPDLLLESLSRRASNWGPHFNPKGPNPKIIEDVARRAKLYGSNVAPSELLRTTLGYNNIPSGGRAPVIPMFATEAEKTLAQKGALQAFKNLRRPPVLPGAMLSGIKQESKGVLPALKIIGRLLARR
jgi:hypothetical protein